LVASGALLGFAGCGDDDEEPAASGAKPSAPAASTTAKSTLTVNVASFKYLPENAVVAKGAKVTFVNKDKAPHTASAEDKSFDTGRLDLDQEREITFTEAGTFSYFCVYHRFMEAKITVK